MQYYTSNTANFGLSFIFHMPIPPCLQGNGHIFFFAVYVMAGLRHVAIWFSGEWKASVRGVNVLEGEGRLRQRQQSVLSDQRVCVRGEPGGLTPPPRPVLAKDGSDGHNSSCVGLASCSMQNNMCFETCNIQSSCGIAFIQSFSDIISPCLS